MSNKSEKLVQIEKKEQISKTNPKWRWILQLAVPEVRKIQILWQTDIFSGKGGQLFCLCVNFIHIQAKWAWSNIKHWSSIWHAGHMLP
jgi:hypothetical protein